MSVLFQASAEKERPQGKDTIIRKGLYMTKQEWLQIGYEKNLIEIESFQELTFFEAYKKWILMKIKMLKCQSVDRIECTFYRYFESSPISDKYISSITDQYIIDFLFALLAQHPGTTYKEFGRIMQIMKGVLTYMHDIQEGGSSLHDWHKITSYVNVDRLSKKDMYEFAIPCNDVNIILDKVINDNIYPAKYNASRLLCMNFYLGLRIGELSALTFSDFDFEKNIINVSKTESKFYERSEDGSKVGTMVYRVVDDCKTVSSIRQVPILPEVKFLYNQILQHHIEMGYESDYLAYDGSQTILIRSLDRTLRKLCKLCNVSYFNSHAIRKTFATVLHNNNVPTRMISDLLGHSEIATTENCYILSYSDNFDKLYFAMESSLNYKIKNSFPDPEKELKGSARRGSNPSPDGLKNE